MTTLPPCSRPGPRLTFPVLCAALFFLGVFHAGAAADVGFFGILKGQSFVQTNSGAAVPESASNVLWRAFVSGPDQGQGQGQSTVTNAQVKTPTAAVVPLDNGGGGGDWETKVVFASVPALDAAFPNGNYTFLMGTVHDGNRTNVITITGNTYPTTPHFSNFNAAQAIDPTAPFSLTWDAIPGATSNDFIQVQISDCGGQKFVETPSPGQPGALNGSVTSFSIPARSLRPGLVYNVELMIGHFATYDTNSYAGASGVGAYISRVTMTLATTGTPLPCPPGRFELDFGYPQFSFNGSTQGVVNFPQGLSYYFASFNLDDSNMGNFPQTVTFTGPNGSGLNNTTNGYGGPGGQGAYYSSPSLNTPPFPPGGLYSVDLGGGNVAQFGLLDPDAIHQQVLLVPTAVVDAGGFVTEMQWVYKSTNGTTVPAQPFMARIELRLDGGLAGTLYDAGQSDEDRILPGTNRYVLHQPVAWTNVANVEMAFHDSAGNRFSSFWMNSPGPLQILTPNLPPGTVGAFYNATLVANGGVGPYSWMLTGGALPPGLALNPNSGNLSGTPTNSGNFNFSVAVTDANSNSVERGYSIGIALPNTPPFISDIPSQSTTQGMATAALPFTIGDAQTPPANLTLSGSSSDQSLVRNSSIVFGGNGSNRTVTVTPDPNRGGTVTITVTVSDGAASAFDTFTLDVQGGGPQIGNQPNIDSYILIKGQSFVQTNGGPVIGDGPSNVILRAWFSYDKDTSVTNAALQLPNAIQVGLSSSGSDDHEIAFQDAFASVSALDSVYPNGTYSFLFWTANDGIKTNRLNLTGNSYPATPHFNNFSAAQAVDPAADFSLTWDPIPGATTNDFLFLRVHNCHDEDDFSTPSPGQPGLLDATRTSVTIPGRSLRPGQDYQIEMLVGRITQMDTNSLPGSLGLAGYIKRLVMPLATQGPGSGCPFGLLSFEFRFRPGGFNGVQGASSYPQGLANYTAYFNVDGDPNAPAYVTFTGPAGSGLNHTTNGTSGSGGGRNGNGLFYATPRLSTPPFPPGGPYVVDYQGASHTNHVLDPHASAQQILIVPNLLTNDSGQVTGVNWFYTDTNGLVLPPPPFMRSIRAQLSNPYGPLFWMEQRDHGGVGPSSTNFDVQPPVALTNIQFVEMAFTDWAGNQFVSEYQVSSANVQIATPLLAGGVLSNAYSQFLLAFGGHPPYLWSLPNGALPAGLALNQVTGEIFGTPTALGLSTFTLRATDTNGSFAERSFGLGISPDGPDAITYVVAKGRRFAQTNANPPAPSVPGFHFVSFVETAAPGRVSGASLTLPGGLIRTLTNDLDRLAYEQLFLTQTALDSAFANGTYTLTMNAVNDGTQVSSLLLTNNAYPAAPRLANWNAAQAIDAQAEFVLAWNPFAGGTSNDLVVINIMNNQGQEVFSTPGYLEPDFLDGTRTSVLIPPHTLTPASPHKGRVLFVKRTALALAGYPNVPGLAAYFAETTFDLATVNPAGLLQFSAAVYPADEGAGTVEITINRLGGTEGSVTVDYTTAGGSANDTDYVFSSGTLTFGDGVANQSFSITLLDDSTPEGPKNILLVLSNVSGGAGLGLANAQVSIHDDDAPPGPAVRYFVAAKGQSFVQTNAAAPGSDPAQPFRFLALAREAFPNGLVAASVRNPNGVTNLLERQDDGSGQFEYDQVFNTKVGLDAAFKNGAYLFNFAMLDGTTANPPLVLPVDAYPNTPHIANWPAAQAINAFADFTLAWDAFAGGTVLDYIQLSIQDTNSGNDVFRSVEFTWPGALNGTNTSIVIPGGTLLPGQTYRGQLLFANLGNLNDTDFPDVIGASAFIKETEFRISTATPPPPQGQIQFVDLVQAVSETNGVATVQLERVGGSQGAVSVTVSTANGTATAGSDYSGASVVVNFADGQTNAQFSFEILDDAIYEGPETVKLALSNPTGGATLAGQTNMVVVIIDNELPPTPGVLQFSAPSYTVAEAAGSVTITVTRTGGSLGEVSVDYATVAGSATPEGDYEDTAGTLVFPNGVTSRTFTVAIDDDDLDETNEVFQVVLSNPANGATLGARSSARVVITDNDLAGVISFSAPAYSISETGAVAEVSVKRSSGTAAVTVDYAALSGTATAGDDFEPTSGTLEFAAGETEKFILVPIFDDVLPEGNETLSLVLTNPTGGAVLGAITNATLTILDDEVVLQFSRTLFTNSEASPLVTFTVTRSGSTADSVSVDFATMDDTALAGEDYAATNGTLVFPSGVTIRTFTVGILNDTAAEDDETFNVLLSNPSGTAQLGPRDTATVLIQDNDQGGVIAFSATNYPVKESAPFALITVVRTLGKASDVTVDFEVRDGIGTADDDSDYYSTNGTLTFGAGISKLTFVVPVREDALVEGSETIYLRLSNPSGGAVLGARSEATVTILDNDVAGSIRFSTPTYSVSETGTVATITALRSGGKATVSVDYTTADGTATNELDYTATAGTLNFGSNELSKTFTIPILPNAQPDGNRTVLLSLSNPGGGAKLIAPTNAVLTILDDELGVQFSSATYSVSEGVSSVALTVVRAGPSPTAFTVHYATADGTATAGPDYTAKSGVLTFGPTVTSQTISIPIKNDIAFEGNETFTVTLSSPSGTAQLGPRSVATVTIVDNDPGAPRAVRARLPRR